MREVLAAMAMLSAHADGSRVEIPKVEDMSSEQRALYDMSVEGLGGAYGPNMALLVTPEIAQRWRDLRLALHKSKVPLRLQELSILLVAREWSSQFEWHAHATRAAKAGLTADLIEAIRDGRSPAAFADDADRIIYLYTRSLLRDHLVDDATYDAARNLLGQRGLVELTVLIGHYINVSMTLNAHRLPLPPGVSPPLAPLKVDSKRQR